MTMPTWDHLWFLVYLLVYALGAAAVGALSKGRRLRAPAWALLVAPPLLLAGANLVILTKAPLTHALVNDWGGHLKWLGLFVTGMLAGGQDRFWSLLEAHWGKALLAAAGLLAIQMRVNDPLWSAVSGLYAWAAICALCGFAKARLDKPSALLAHLNEAVLPIYVLHQPILLVAAFWLLPLKLPTAVEAVLLTLVTGAGSLLIYELAIRPFDVLRFLFGLKAQPASSTPRPAGVAYEDLS